MRKVLLLGPKYSKSGEVGGIVVSFELMQKEFEKLNILTNIVDLNKGNYQAKPLAFFQILLKSLYLIPQSDAILLNGTAKDFKYIAPLLVFFSKLFKRKIILRKFAGSFIEEYQRSSNILQWIIRYTLKNSTANFFQTKYLISYFKKYNVNTFWLPTSREKPKIQRDKNTPYQKKFIYLGHIREEKGIYDLLQLSKSIDHSYTIDLYGSLIEIELFEVIEDSNLNYYGELKPSEVLNTLTHYDVLILPSYREGYPGVIIEALSVGLPIVATNLEAISEIIDEQCGILIPTKDVTALKHALETFTIDNYPKYSENAQKQFQLFDSEVVIQKVVKQL